MVKKGYITIKQASDYIEQSPNTLRRWDNSGALKAYRHPINKYRLYKKSDLDKFLKRIKHRRTK